MKWIQLTKGKVALVDDEDFEWLNSRKWHAWWSGSNWYALDGKRRYMHRIILGLTRFSQKGDHKDGNGLNNCRHNLRASTSSQNAVNSKLRSTNKSGLRGVSWAKRERMWTASIGNGIRLGYFHVKEDAARAYDSAAIYMYGEFARVNYK